MLAAFVFPAASPAGAQTLFRSWHLTMSDIQARSGVAMLKGERQHDAQGTVRVRGVIGARRGSESNPEELFFDVGFTTTLLRNTEYDPDFARIAAAAGYRHRRRDYTVELFGEHFRRMNTDRVGRRNANFFGAAFADPEFKTLRFGAARRLHGRIAAGAIVNENGFSGEGRYIASLRYDFEELTGRQGRMALPKGQVFIEADADAIDAPGGLMADVEAGVRFLFYPEADNSISVAAKFYDSKNPFGHGDDGVRIEVDLEGGHAGELFKSFLGNTAGEVVMGARGEDIASELAADFDLVRLNGRGKDWVIVLDTLQRATWGRINKIEYNLQGGAETRIDPDAPFVGRHLPEWIMGLYLDHRSTHGLDRALPEKNYNLVRLAFKTQGWDPGRENETRGRVAAHFSIGRYAENSFKKSRDVDGRAGIRIDAAGRPWGTWTLAPYLKTTVRNATDAGRRAEVTAEAGVRFNQNALFARWTQDAYFGEGGLGGVALRF
ncbi:MAG: hypothetical protein A3G34_09380 [Candidatus Lindowbacteria bacterium RIFCSPLOWO2_12_FULL_62_27]|nr:MAG: hypothetical protein A3I06_08045 [Candidatus Lindowbacteria bacterium RIFCSPLOWO2_02_FULL_62_12]OGH60248.1 MAG: hypothetical protein A3G34_09380 [Candidatus Lindowbacteria bacterium RIFCSPLOWO2_12_FULL_62_27]